MNILLTTALGSDKDNYIKDLRSKYPVSVIVGIDMAYDPQSSVPQYVSPELSFMYKSPHGRDPKYLSFIKELVDAHNIDIIIPCSDPETITFMDSGYNEVPVVGTNATTKLEDIYDKLECINIINKWIDKSQSGILVTPMTSVLTSPDMLRHWISIKGTVVVKPLAGYGSRGLMIVSNETNDFNQIMMKGSSHQYSTEMAINILNSYPGLEPGDTAWNGQFIVQEYWSGPSYNVECAVANGELVACVPHLRTGYRWGRLDEGTLVKSKVIEECAQNLIDALGITHGLFNFEANNTSETSPLIGLVEVNPRVSAVHSQCKLLGYDMIDAGIQLALGNIPPSFDTNTIDTITNGGSVGYKYYITESEVGHKFKVA